MIFDEITLHNYCAYKGEHTIGLTPKSSDHPIVLIGGYNGAGKTSLFNAFLLVLFGKHANQNSGISYDHYLKKAINKHVPPREGARIALTFRHRSNGEENTYRVIRSWCSTGKAVKEKVDIYFNGEYDGVLSESWGEVVEDFIPMEISRLFFFDGEKIKVMAEEKKTAQIISTGLYSLLGLNLIDKLRADLGILKKKKAVSVTSREDQERIAKIDADVKGFIEQRSIKKLKLGRIQNELDTFKKQLKDKEREFKNAGGGLFESRQELHHKKVELEARINEVKGRLRELAASALPLTLVKPLLRQIHQQSQAEHQAHQARTLLTVLGEKDQGLLSFLREKSSDPSLVQEVASFLDQEYKTLEIQNQIEPYLNLNDGTRNQVEHLLSSQLPDLSNRSKQANLELEALEEELILVNRQLEMVPEEQSLLTLIGEIEFLRASVKRTTHQLELATEEHKMAKTNVEIKEVELSREIEKSITQKVADEEKRRIVEYSGRVQEIILKYKLAMIKQHVSRIEERILSSIQSLFRKKDFISAFTIDPNDFHFDLFDKKGEPIQLHQLSAGEKQLVVTSILWGLAQSSDFPIPAIIDTPLGRLDSKHRTKIIERYFPKASHQVILLSTDEEIANGYLDKLSPWISQAYLLNYNEKNESTCVDQGYFGRAS